MGVWNLWSKAISVLCIKSHGSFWMQRRRKNMASIFVSNKSIENQHSKFYIRSIRKTSNWQVVVSTVSIIQVLSPDRCHIPTVQPSNIRSQGISDRGDHLCKPFPPAPMVSESYLGPQNPQSQLAPFKHTQTRNVTGCELLSCSAFAANVLWQMARDSSPG